MENQMEPPKVIGAVKVLHVGIPKTGTTWLQQVVLPILGETRIVDFSFGQSGAARWSSPLASLHKIARGQESTHDKEVLKALFSSGSFFVSAETLTGDSNLTQQERAAALSEVVPSDTTIVITVRDFRSWISSLFQEEIKSRLYSSEQQFMEGRPASFHCPAWNFGNVDVPELVRAYAQNFKKVVVINMDQLSHLDWLRRIGVPSSIVERIQDELQLRPKAKNVSLGARQVVWLLRLNSFLSWLARNLPEDEDARTRFVDLPMRQQIRQLWVRIGIALKITVVVPLLQAASTGKRFVIPQQSIDSRFGLTESWTLESLKTHFGESEKVTLIL
jgi:hypothetical protein